MALSIDDMWIWDFWLANDGERFHLFFLQAPRSLQDLDLRHHNASIGHAISEDLVDWTVLGTVLEAGSEGAIDSLATWTGSVIEHDGTWFMFYTGASIDGGQVTQRIGLATSPDLMEWNKVPGFVVEADARWYEKLDPTAWYEEAWRDPWVFRGEDGRFHMLVTARAAQGPPDGRGVVGHAVSDDLLHWEVLPPITEPGEFGHLEVPQVERIGDQFVLVFSVDSVRASAVRTGRLIHGTPDATYIVAGDGDLGPFDISAAVPALGSDLYTGRLLENQAGTWVWLACQAWDDDGQYVGALTDPIAFDPGILENAAAALDAGG